MKATPYLAAFFGLSLIAARPVPTTDPQPPLDQKDRLTWVPEDAYRLHPAKKSQWQQKCDDALAKAGCRFGILHAGYNLAAKSPNSGGRTMAYVNVEGAPSPDQLRENPIKMRVFMDGSSVPVDDWSARDLKVMEARKNRKKEKGPLPVPAEGQNAVLAWSPADAYKKSAITKAYWEDKCQKAFAREGCGFGVIYAGEHSLTKPNGAASEKGNFVNVEAAPSPGMEPTRKMRVFQDGSSEDVRHWSWRDQLLMKEARRRRVWQPKPQIERQEGQKVPAGALLFWDPATAYRTQRHKRKYWEERCDEAITREGCWVAMIHQGERKSDKPNGEKTTYINVDAASSLDGSKIKKMRVYHDASSEYGWSTQDRTTILQAKRTRRTHRPRTNNTNKAITVGSEQANTSTEDHPKANKPIISWNPPLAYEKNPFLKKSFEEACHTALEIEGCEFGKLQRGYHRLKHAKNPDGTPTRYMNVFAGKYSEPQSQRYMKLFENGTWEWYPPGPLPKPKSKNDWRNRRRQRRIEEQEKDKVPSTQEQGTSERPRKRTREQERAGGGDSQSPETQAPTQGSPKRQRIGGDEGQNSSQAPAVVVDHTKSPRESSQDPGA